MVYTDNGTITYRDSFITFPTWVKKPSKCATHTHRFIMTGKPHGLRITENRTIMMDEKWGQHSDVNCITVWPNQKR